MAATIESILEVGYAATTVRSVAERAGVSLGARSHFFPRRIDMIVAAFDQLCADRIAAAYTAVEQIPTAAPERMYALLDMMWNDYTSTNFVAGMKLFVAASDDPELHTHLVASTQTVQLALDELYVHAIGEQLANLPEIRHRITMAHELLLGHAFSRAFEPVAPPHPLQAWADLRANLERLILS